MATSQSPDSQSVLLTTEPKGTSQGVAVNSSFTSVSTDAKMSFGELVSHTDGRNRYDVNILSYLHKNHKQVMHFKEEGRKMMDACIRELAAKQDYVTIVEIGVWLGRSTARWLRVAPNVRVIGVDPFEHPNQDHKYLAKVPMEYRKHFGNPIFNKAMATYEIDQRTQNAVYATSRFALLTGYYPDAAQPVLQHRIHDLGGVDILYIDGGKNDDPEAHKKLISTFVDTILEAYPETAISGDDWSHGSNYNHKIFQAHIMEIARSRNRKLYVSGKRTWIMPAQPLSDEVAKLGQVVV